MITIRLSNGASLKALAAAYAEGIPEPVKADISRAVAANFALIWETQGAALSAQWNGSDLIQTGSLKAYMLSLQGITIDENGITKLIRPEYGKYVNQTKPFAGWTEDFRRQVLRIISAPRGNQ